MVLIFIFVLFIIIHDSEKTDSHEEVFKNIEINDSYESFDFEGSNDMNNTSENQTIEEIAEEDLQDTSSSRSSGEKQKRSHRIPSVNDIEVNKEKLVFLPSRALQPPKLEVRNRANRREFIENQFINPRPFSSNQQKPSPFNKQNTTNHQMVKIGSIQDILKYTPKLQNQKIHFSGYYRHPRKNDDFQKYLNHSTNGHDSYQKNIPYPNTPMSVMPDPLYNFKPHSPSEVNLMAVKPFGFSPNNEQTTSSTRSPRFMKHNQQPYKTDFEQMYQKIITTNNNRNNGYYDDISRNGRRKHRPFQLMLDVYPMPEDEVPATTNYVRPRPIRKPSHYPRYSTPPPTNVDAINNLLYHGHIENNYFRSMAFPQLQPPGIRRPNKYQQNDIMNKMNYIQAMNQNSKNSDYSFHPQSFNDNQNQPSKLVVHLNLYPKNKNGVSRSSKEERSDTKLIEKRSSIENEPKNEITLGKTISVTSDEFPKQLADIPTESNGNVPANDKFRQYSNYSETIHNNSE